MAIGGACRYGGQCAEFCGLNHSQMYFNIRAVELPEYEAWLGEMRSAGGAAPPPDGAAPVHDAMTDSEEG